MRRVFRSVTTIVTLLSAAVARCQVRPAVTETADVRIVIPANWTRKETPRGTVNTFGVNGAAVMVGQTPVSDATLRAALAAVPVANRPIAMPTRRETRSLGGYNFVVYKPWMAFANGYATDSRCYDWDPRALAPTPQSLGAAGKRCDLVRWRRVGTSMQFQKADGTWESDDKGAVLYPFTPGLRLDRTLENAGGTGSTPGVGAIAVNTVFRGGLQMTAAGTMQSDWRNDTAISGAGIGGGASGSGTYLAGRYFADGYLIAVADARGTVSVAFIAGSHDEGEPRYTHIYLNGRQYWPRDR
jgi:hypothetical protein